MPDGDRSILNSASVMSDGDGMGTGSLSTLMVLSLILNLASVMSDGDGRGTGSLSTLMVPSRLLCC